MKTIKNSLNKISEPVQSKLYTKQIDFFVLKNRWLFFPIVLLLFSQCCQKSNDAMPPYETIAVKFDTIQPGGITSTDIDTVIVKYRRVYQDSSTQWKKLTARDTYYADGFGNFKYKNITYSKINIGLTWQGGDSVWLYAGTREFVFSNLILEFNEPKKCSSKRVTTKHEITLNNIVFNLQKSEQIIGNYSWTNGVFLIK